MNKLPIHLENSKQKFLTVFNEHFMGLGFQSLDLKHELFILPYGEGHLGIYTDFRSINQNHDLAVQIGFGVTHYAVERVYAELTSTRIERNGVIIRVTLGGAISNFIPNQRPSIHISDENTIIIVQDIGHKFNKFVLPYLQPLLMNNGLLNELRNPNHITKKLIMDTVTQSQLIMIAAYLTDDIALWKSVMYQEEQYFKTKLPPDFYGGYTKVEELLNKLHEEKST